MRDRIKKRYIGIVLFMIAVLCVIRSFMLCTGDDIWYDELFTIEFCKRPIGEMISLAAKDVHPPLYYIITSLGIRIISTVSLGSIGLIAAAKIMSVIPYVLMLIMAATIIRKEFGWLTCGVFSFAVMTMPQLPSYTVEIRMYGWAMFFVTAVSLAAYRFFMTDRTKGTIIRDAIITVICGIAACYTHYYACIAVAAVYLLMLIYMISSEHMTSKYYAKDVQHINTMNEHVSTSKCRILRIGLSFLMPLVLAIAYVPWLNILAGQIGAVKSSYWIQPLTWRTLAGCVKFLFRPDITDNRLSVILALVLFAVYAYCFLRAVKSVIIFPGNKAVSSESVSGRSENSKSAKSESGDSESVAGLLNDSVSEDRAFESSRSRYNYHRCRMKFGLICFFSMIILIIIGFVASFLIRPVFVYRYMIPACGLWWLAFAVFIGCMTEDVETEPGSSASSLKAKPAAKVKSAMIVRVVIEYAMLAFTVFVGIYSFHSFVGNEKYKSVQMAETDKLFANIEPGTRIICNFDHVQAISAYMLDGRDNQIYLIGGEPEELINEMLPSAKLLGDESDIRLWLRQGGKVLFFGSFNSRDDILADWKSSYGITSKDTGSFMDERYWFDVYELSLGDDRSGK